MSRKSKKDDDLDTQTTFADMNVDGFKWFDPSKKKDEDLKKIKPKITRKEYWRMVRGAFAAFLPFFAVILVAFGLIIGLTYLWLS